MSAPFIPHSLSLLVQRLTRPIHVSLALLPLVAGPALAQSTLPQPQATTPVVIDGETTPEEWPAGVVAQCDEDWLYFRVKLAGEPQTLQGMPRTLALWVDADSNMATGDRRALRNGASFGVDFEVRFSPRELGSRGVEVVAHGAGGAARVTSDRSRVHFAPTYASSGWYEVRVSRDIAEVPGLHTQGDARSVFVLHEPDGTIGRWRSEPFTFSKPAFSGVTRHEQVDVPARHAGAVRVVSWNVERDSPVQEADRVARVISALDADILLFQEWDSSAADVERWFKTNLPGEEWYVIRGEGQGVLIVSRMPSTPLGPARLALPDAQHPIRFVGATIYTPYGQAAVASVHLKCCGTLDSSEDIKRSAEASLINETMRKALNGSRVRARVIGGDFNLVGGRRPLDTMARGLDETGSPLNTARAGVLGDRASYTWRDAGTPFAAGRLDYMLVSESGARIAQSFVLDTSVLSESALSAVGLRHDDTLVSDHLPLVADLVIR